MLKAVVTIGFRGFYNSISLGKFPKYIRNNLFLIWLDFQHNKYKMHQIFIHSLTSNWKELSFNTDHLGSREACFDWLEEPKKQFWLKPTPQKDARSALLSFDAAMNSKFRFDWIILKTQSLMQDLSK